MELTHANLTALAVKWLQRPASRNGAECRLAVSECRSGWTGEIPDAIGWRASGHLDGSVVVEVKVSRSDFLADARKPHRNGDSVGLGNWRYYLCPEGIITPSDLPPKWGLLYANTRGHIKPVVGPMLTAHHGQREAALRAMRQNSDFDGERFILVRLLGRIGDVEETHRQLREKYRLGAKVVELERELREIRRENSRLRRRVHVLDAGSEERHP